MTTKGKLIVSGVAVIALGAVLFSSGGLGKDLASAVFSRTPRLRVVPTAVQNLKVVARGDGFVLLQFDSRTPNAPFTLQGRQLGGPDNSTWNNLSYTALKPTTSYLSKTYPYSDFNNTGYDIPDLGIKLYPSGNNPGSVLCPRPYEIPGKNLIVCPSSEPRPTITQKFPGRHRFPMLGMDIYPSNSNPGIQICPSPYVINYYGIVFCPPISGNEGNVGDGGYESPITTQRMPFAAPVAPIAPPPPTVECAWWDVRCDDTPSTTDFPTTEDNPTTEPPTTTDYASTTEYPSSSHNLGYEIRDLGIQLYPSGSNPGTQTCPRPYTIPGKNTVICPLPELRSTITQSFPGPYRIPSEGGMDIYPIDSNPGTTICPSPQTINALGIVVCPLSGKTAPYLFPGTSNTAPYLFPGPGDMSVVIQIDNVQNDIPYVFRLNGGAPEVVVVPTPTTEPPTTEDLSTTEPPTTTECYKCYDCFQVYVDQCSCTKTGNACTESNQTKQADFNRKAEELATMIKDNNPNTKNTVDAMADELDRTLDDQDVENLVGALSETLIAQSIVINPDTPMGNECTNKELKRFKWAISRMNSNINTIKELCAEGGACNAELLGIHSQMVNDDGNKALAIVNATLTNPDITPEQREALIENRRKIFELMNSSSRLTGDCLESTMEVIQEQQNALLTVTAASLATVLTVGYCSPMLLTELGVATGGATLITLQSASIMGMTVYNIGLIEPVIQAYERTKTMGGNSCDNFWNEYSRTNPAARKEALKAALWTTATALVGGPVVGNAIKGAAKLKVALINTKSVCSSVQMQQVAQYNGRCMDYGGLQQMLVKIQAEMGTVPWGSVRYRQLMQEAERIAEAMLKTLLS